MKKYDTSKPLMLYLAESIYLKISNIKTNEPNITLIDAIEIFLTTNEFNKIRNGDFHKNLFNYLEKNEFINPETGNKIRKETLDLLKIQRDTVMKQLKSNSDVYYTKSSFPLSSSQDAFGLVWRMCETYELWCKEIKAKELIKLNLLD